MSAPKNLAIGIDLGTTYSCVGVWKNNAVEIIANDQGNRTTPSYVSFAPDSAERLVGDAAKNQAARNPKNTVFDAKRLIGRAFTNEHVQQDMKLWPFAVKDDGNNKPVIQVEFNNEKKTFHPEEVSSMVLSKMKTVAEAYIGSDVTQAVITVPAYFNDAQRQATKNASQIAGMEALRIINEPTAAAIAYGLDKKNEGGNSANKKAQNVLIYDMGGGTFDVSLLKIEDGVFEVRATAGDTHLGGEDFDNQIVDHCIAEFQKEHPDIDLSGNHRALRRLRTACERAKRALSSNTTTTIEVDSLADGHDFSYALRRAKFEELNAKYFKSDKVTGDVKVLDPVKRVLKDAGCDLKDVDEIVMVGGSTRIPKVQSLLQEMFGGKELCHTINPDEAVAYGAAIQAGILTGEGGDACENLLLLDVTPLSLGLETVGGVMTKIIERNTTIPCKKSDIFTTESDNQTRIKVDIYEGERYKSKDNNLLGSFDLDGIAPAPRGVAQVEITYDLDANGILHVTARDKASAKKNNITIENKGRFNQDEIDQMIADAEKFKAQDDAQANKTKAREEVKNYLYSIQDAFENEQLLAKVTADDIVLVEETIMEALEWVERNENVEEEQLKAKKKEIETRIKPVMTKLYAEKARAAAGGNGKRKARR